jgi:ubiquitin-conjugating enzyme E2 G1
VVLLYPPNLSVPCSIQYSIPDLAKNPIDLISVGLADDANLYDWEILMMGPNGTLYEGGFFKAHLVFPSDFPNMPPTTTFVSEMWHPNVYEDGRVCISILHSPGEDEFNSQESADERWRPILGVEQMLVSSSPSLTVVGFCQPAPCKRRDQRASNRVPW